MLNHMAMIHPPAWVIGHKSRLGVAIFTQQHGVSVEWSDRFAIHF